MLNFFLPLSRKDIRKPVIAIIKIYGAIAENNPLIEHALYAIRMLQEQPLDGLILQISGNGGAISVAQEISAEINKLKASTSCVVISQIGEQAFSGSFYIALSSDIVLCQPGSMVGSIGAIFQHRSFTNLHKKLGIHYEAIMSGPQKDLLNPSRDLSNIDKEALNELVIDIHEQFLEWIYSRRNIKNLERYADGRIFSGKKAKELGLVDGFGGLSDAIEAICNRKNCTDPELTFYEPKQTTHSTMQNILRDLGITTLLGK